MKKTQNHEVDIQINGVVRVPVFINDVGPFWLLLDTGCIGCSVTPDVAQKTKMESADGTTACLRSLAIGSTCLTDIMFGIDDAKAVTRLLGQKVEGFLGNGLLHYAKDQFDLVIDYPKSSLAFRPVLPRAVPKPISTAASTQAPSRVSIQLENWYTIVPVHIDGQGPYRFFLDTGASSCVVSPQIAHRYSLPQGEQVTAQGVVEDMEARRSVVPRLSIGQATCERLEVLVMDCTQISSYVFDHIDGYIGNNFLQHFEVTLNYRDKKMLLR